MKGKFVYAVTGTETKENIIWVYCKECWEKIKFNWYCNPTPIEDKNFDKLLKENLTKKCCEHFDYDKYKTQKIITELFNPLLCYESENPLKRYDCLKEQEITLLSLLKDSKKMFMESEFFGGECDDDVLKAFDREIEKIEKEQCINCKKLVEDANGFLNDCEENWKCSIKYENKFERK